jgi:hypothetical protein
MKRLIQFITVPLVALITVGSQVHAAVAPEVSLSLPTPMRMGAETRSLTTPIQFKHGDISWLPMLALQAGWPKKTHKRLGEIILRESGGCPGRIGGSIVSPDCAIIGWDNGPPHKSDSGLLQINGVHWKQDHKEYAGLVCKVMGVCNQARLLDPLTNLRAGKLLFDVAGWSPWHTN